MEKEGRKAAIERNKLYSSQSLVFTSYCLKKIEQRGIDRQTVADMIFNKEDILMRVQPQQRLISGVIEDRYKLIYRLSNKEIS